MLTTVYGALCDSSGFAAYEPITLGDVSFWSITLPHTVKSLNAEIKLLQAQKTLVEKRDGEVPKALAVLRRYATVLTPAQRRQIAGLIDPSVPPKVQATPKASQGPLKGRKLGKVSPKYQLPSGETWTGRGLTPKVFTSWAKSAEGKAWVGANAGERFPSAGPAKRLVSTRKSAGNVAKAEAKKAPGKKVSKKMVRKVVATKVAKKVAKKGAKKAVG